MQKRQFLSSPKMPLTKSRTFFQEVLANLRATSIGNRLPSSAEILHRRNLAWKRSSAIGYKAVRTILQDRHLKQALSHKKSHWAKKVRDAVCSQLMILGKNVSLQVPQAVTKTMTFK